MTIRKGHTVTLVKFDIPVNNRPLNNRIKVEKRVVKKGGEKYFFVATKDSSLRRFEQDSVGKIVAGIWVQRRIIVATDEESKQAAIALASETLKKLAKERIDTFNALISQHSEALQEGMSIEEI
tara:strand:+ start:1891 stop:2262 length:372 start_codon:yes stop_codon:yes gene_type:complete